MGSYKQILVLAASLVWLLVCVQGSVIRRKREGPEAVASFFMDKLADGMSIIEHGAGYKGQQDHQFDVFGAKAGVDAKPTIGFGDAVRNDEKRRRKREAEGEQQDPDARDIQNVFQQMWSAIVDGGKQIVKKVGEMIDRDAPNQQAQREQPQQTY